jgi:hypothetical protein
MLLYLWACAAAPVASTDSAALTAKVGAPPAAEVRWAEATRFDTYNFVWITMVYA